MRNYLKNLKFALLSFQTKNRNKLFNRLFANQLQNILQDLKSKGIKINTIYDIGARLGEWSKEIQEALPSSNFILFEANENCRKALKKTGHRFFIGVLSSEKKVVRFFQNGSTGDSYYKEATSYYDKVEAVDKQATTLGDLAIEENLPQPDLIKLDTQGSELDILNGGLSLLKNTSLIYLECPILAYNIGAPSFDIYISHLKKIGFIPYQLCEVHHLNNVLVQVDILFISNTILKKLNNNLNVDLYFT
jgi:FkbM family methyltransferase